MDDAVGAPVFDLGVHVFEVTIKASHSGSGTGVLALYCCAAAANFGKAPHSGSATAQE